MKLIPVGRALAIGWAIIGMVALFSIGGMIAMIAVSTMYNWPQYIAIPSVFIVMLALLMGGFHYSAKKWMAWIYMHVDDVAEFEKAAQMSGFGGYPPGSIANESVRAMIMERLNTYEFVDDLTVPGETMVFFKEPYQNTFFITMSAGFVLSLIEYTMHSSVGTLLVLVAFFAVAAAVNYYKYSDRSPQIVLSDTGITANGNFHEWQGISFYQVIQGETSYLYYLYNGDRYEIEVKNLTVGRRGLNHLLHVYSSRGKQCSI